VNIADKALTNTFSDNIINSLTLANPRYRMATQLSERNESLINMPIYRAKCCSIKGEQAAYQFGEVINHMLMLMYKLQLHKCIAVQIIKPDMINMIRTGLQ